MAGDIEDANLEDYDYIENKNKDKKKKKKKEKKADKDYDKQYQSDLEKAKQLSMVQYNKDYAHSEVKTKKLVKKSKLMSKRGQEVEGNGL